MSWSTTPASRRTGTPVTNTDVEVFRRTYETNVFGVVAVTNTFLPALRRSAHPRIVNVSSGTGSLTWSTGPNPQFDYRRAGYGLGRRLPLLQDRPRRAHRLLRASARQRRLQSQRPRARPAGDKPQPQAAAGGDPAEAAAGAIRLALLPDDGPTGQLFPGTARSCHGETEYNPDLAPRAFAAELHDRVRVASGAAMRSCARL